jgi:hypothetical protein
MVEPLIGYGLPSPPGTYLAPGLGVLRDLAAGRVELDQLLDAVSTGPRWLERRDVAGSSRFAPGAVRTSPPGRSGLRPGGQEHHKAVAHRQPIGSCIGAARDSRQETAKTRLEAACTTASPEYIENNPVKAGVCGSVQHWPWSPAAQKCG